MLALFSLTTRIAFAFLHFQALNWGARVLQPFWNPLYRTLFYNYEKETLIRYCLASGLLFAALLIYRSIGYRLYRPLPPPFAVSGPEARQVIAHAVRHG